MGSISNEVTGFFNGHNPSSHTMALGSTWTLNINNEYQVSSWWGKGQPVRKADNLATVSEPTA
jgi:hypothetical protein